MPGKDDRDRTGRTALAARAAALIVALAGTVALVGWSLGSDLLRSMAPALVAMNPATAIAFLLAGAALWLGASDGASGARRRLQRGIAVGLALEGAIELVTTIAGVDAGLDRLLFRDALAAAAPYPNRMAPNTALGFLLAGSSLALLDGGRRARMAQALALAGGAIGLFAVLGYLYGVDRLYGVPSYIPMALNTALAFVTLSVGILLARAHQGFMAVVSAETSAGYLARRLIPVALLLPPILGALRLAGERGGLYGTEFGVALTAVATIAALIVVVWLTAERLDRIERRRALAEAEVQRQSARFQDLYDHSPCGYHSLDAEGRFVEMNRTELGWFGYERDEVVGRLRFVDVMTPASREVFHRNFPHFKETGEVHDLEFEMVRKDGTTFPVALSATALYDEAGRYVRSRSTLSDITERRRAERAVLDLNQELEAFSYSVSHDLRAPLRSVIGFAQFLAEDHAAALDDEGRKLLARIDGAATRMGHLIDDLLGLARLGRAEMQREAVDLSALARQVGEGLREGDPGRDVEIAVAGGLRAEGDPRLLRVAIENLMANAWKFTRGMERPRIEFDAVAAQNGGPPVFFVRDNGAGFDMRYAEKLFAPFQRLHRVDEFEGSGIGLATVQRIVHRHGGEIWAEAEVGRGASFFFRLG